MKRISLLFLLSITPSVFAQNLITTHGQIPECRWDDTNKRLGIGETNPLSTLHINGGIGAGSTGLCFGDGDSCIFELADDIITFSSASISRFAVSGTSFTAIVTDGPFMRNVTSTATVPGFSPRKSDADTGIGSAGDDILSFVAGGVETARSVEGGTYDQFIVSPDGIQNDQANPSLAFGNGVDGFFQPSTNQIAVSINTTQRFLWLSNLFGAINVNGGAIQNLTSSNILPTLLPARTDSNTGLGHAGAEQLSLIANGIEGIRVNDAEAHSVAGIANYETLVVNDDDIPNRKFVVDLIPVFGTEFQQSYVATESSTTSATYQQKLRITTAVVPAGTYRIGFKYNWSVNSANVGAEFRVEIDDTTTIFNETPVPVKQYANGEYNTTGGFAYTTLTNASHTIDLDYRNTNGNTTYIKEARLEIWRVQ